MGIGLNYDQRWTGLVTPTDQAACGPPTQATLTRRARTFTFTPNDGALVIGGLVTPDNHLAGKLALSGADHHPYDVTIDGALAPNGFRGVYKTPRCTAEVTLRPAP